MSSRGRLLSVLLVVLVAAGVAVAVWLRGGDPPTPPVAAFDAVQSEPADPQDAAAKASGDQVARDSDVRAPSRQANAGGAMDEAADPAIAAAMAVIAGRVMTHDGKPASECGVKLLRFDANVLFTEQLDLFAGVVPDFSQVRAGETRTGEDGRFEITGTWPRAFYLVQADWGGENPTAQIVPAVPGPGQRVDIGDLVLHHAATIAGRVIDAESGDPVAGATVRAADVPSIVTQVVPVEQFDPEGWVVFRDDNATRSGVFRVPAFVQKLFEELPIPVAHTDADGRFVLQGVVPGVHLVAIAKDGYRAHAETNVKVEPGQDRSIGSVRLSEGEFAEGMVVDTAGERVARAQVLVAQKAVVAPVGFAQRLVAADDRGEFEVTGFGSGEVMVAARRSERDAWTVSEPQSIQRPVRVVLPAQATLTVTVRGADGTPVAEPDLRLAWLPGDASPRDAAGMLMFGLLSTLPLEGRLRQVDEGTWQIEGLDHGRYMLLARAPGYAAVSDKVELPAQARVALTLPVQAVVDLRVLDPEGAPLANVRVYGESRGGERVHEVPVYCGRTAADGTLRITELEGEEAALSALHPAYGAVGTRVKLPASEPVVMRMAAPGAIAGVVSSGGAAPPLGKYMVAANRTWSANRQRGPVDDFPLLAPLDAEGHFTMKGVSPGEYEVRVMDSLSGLRSFGSFAKMAMTMAAMNLPETEVQVASGQTAEVALDTEVETPIDGPTARVYGTVLVNGRPGEGLTVSTWAGRRRVATVDAGGRFDLGTVRAGNCQIQVMDLSGDDAFGPMGSELWQATLKLGEGEERQVTVDVQTGIVRGLVLLPDGQPAAGVQLRLRGALAAAVGSEQEARASFHAFSDAEGRFAIERVPAGEYDISGNRPSSGRGSAKLSVAAGLVAQVRLQLERMHTLRGHLDVSKLEFEDESRGRGWVYLSLQRRAGDGENRDSRGSGVNEEDGTFKVDGLLPGTSDVRVYGRMKGNWVAGSVEIGMADREGVELTPEREPEKPPEQVLKQALPAGGGR